MGGQRGSAALAASRKVAMSSGEENSSYPSGWPSQLSST